MKIDYFSTFLHAIHFNKIIRKYLPPTLKITPIIIASCLFSLTFSYSAPTQSNEFKVPETPFTQTLPSISENTFMNQLGILYFNLSDKKLSYGELLTHIQNIQNIYATFIPNGSIIQKILIYLKNKLRDSMIMQEKLEKSFQENKESLPELHENLRQSLKNIDNTLDILLSYITNSETLVNYRKSRPSRPVQILIIPPLITMPYSSNTSTTSIQTKKSRKRNPLHILKLK